ncbi:MAG TPA: DUF2382 domain-containing protein [Gemmatimonadaceae bacterium]|jgi:uncharacterized protein (TIGR02271 family)|nr:DUF2382 domain-containing protein [Gemmatimonadaceae bacterium]
MADQYHQQLDRLDELDDYTVAEGDPDPRGWDVVASDGRKVGEVKHLIADPTAMRVRYLEVEVDRGLLAGATSKDRLTLVPIGDARLDDDRDRVILTSLSSADVVSLPMHAKGASIGRDYETRHVSRFTGAQPPTRSGSGSDFYAREQFDENRFRRNRPTTDDRSRLTLSEEEIEVGTRRVEGGMVSLRKVVDTERVTKSVPVSREEVTVERRPISADTRGTEVTIGEDEVRIPVMEEELVVDKRAVPKEEIVVSKKMVTEQREVEADVRRERIEVDDSGTRAGGKRAKGGARGSAEQLADRAANKVDDLKDRVDGNPASRPGPDPTDSERRI